MAPALLACLVLVAASAFPAAAESPLAPTGTPSVVTAQAPAPATAPPERSSRPPSRNGAPPAPKEEAKPTWAELSPAQQQSLGPLAASWKTLSEAHKRKWIALAANYPRMSPPEQARLRSRMTEWAALSPQQRTQARLNFAETEKLPATDKKAAWEAYQALSPEEKKKLAAGATQAKPPPPPTAPAVRPVEPQKQAKVPPRKSDSRAPGLAARPNQVDQHTLLPQPGASAAPANN